jgi:hypothetical protein
MNRPAPLLDPWKLVWGQPFIDCQTLATAIEQDLAGDPCPDFRTRLLVRDAAFAIQSYWGPRRFIFQVPLVLEQADSLDHNDQQLESGRKTKAHEQLPRKRAKGRARKDKPGE